MKCPACERDSNKTDRGATLGDLGACPGCQPKFVLDPAQGLAVSDYFFHTIIEAVSARGALHFSAAMLREEMRSRILRRSIVAGPVIGLLILFIISLVVTVNLFGIFGVKHPLKLV